jgi:hypothetical protein
LVVRFAKENTGWGYTRILDVLYTLGHEIGRTTVRRILAEDGIEPAVGPENSVRPDFKRFPLLRD